MVEATVEANRLGLETAMLIVCHTVPLAPLTVGSRGVRPWARHE